MELDVRKLKLAMARKEVNTRDLEKISGLSANSISSFLSGRKKPSLKSIGKMANALGVDVTEILED